MPIDDTKSFTVMLMPPIASIQSIGVVIDGMPYDVYPGGQTAYARAGQAVELWLRVANIGDADGNIIVEVVEDTGVIGSQTKYVSIGSPGDFTFYLTMPNHNWFLTINAGH